MNDQSPPLVPTLTMMRQGRREILAVAAKHGASNVRIFGSVARGEAREGSDVDLLVDMAPGCSLFDLAGLHIELEELLGCEIDIGTGVKPRMREHVAAEAVPLSTRP